VRGLAWLAFLGPFFFLSYGFANWLSAERGDVGVVVFAWERHIPFIPWTIVPYWLIDVLYAASLLMFLVKRALDIHALRLLIAQLIAVGCFIAFPLRFSFERPSVDGAYAVLFDVLASFDRPFNQAPSLHIALLVILWLAYFKRLPRGLHLPIHCIFLLIGVSVLTTWQHHFIDVPTGLWLGWFCVWLVPSHACSPIAESRLANDSRRQRIALRYGIAAAIIFVIASVGGGVWLWSLWPCASIAMMAMIYLFGTERWFQKSTSGRLSHATSWLLWPYLKGAWINSRLWTRGLSRRVEVSDGVFLGRMPSAREHRIDPFPAIVDVCAELPSTHGAAHYVCVPMLDLVTPTHDQLDRATAALEHSRVYGRVLVCCALGFSRSALVVAAWLIETGRAPTPEAAVARVRAARPEAVIDAAHLACLRDWRERQRA